MNLTQAESVKFIPESIKSCKVFFYIAEESFPHLSICIAEGLKELGIEVYSNINYWKISPDSEEYLFRYDPAISHADCSVVVLDKNWTVAQLAFPEGLFHANRNYLTVFLDDQDGPWLCLYLHISKEFDCVFRTHYTSPVLYPENITSHADLICYQENLVPWVFGISQRILQETHHLPSFEQRQKAIISNFRVDQKHIKFGNMPQKIAQGVLFIEEAIVAPENPIRPLIRQAFLPLIQKVLFVDETIDSFDTPPESDPYHYLQWVQTGSRHYPQYYQRLKESVACAAFAGWLTPYETLGKSLVEWWDSWRFWESLATGCVTFHVDFDKYGIKLPVMPENWRHYIGVDLDNMQDTVDRIADEPEILERISREGRQWAMSHYSPVPTALRFLETLGFLSDLPLFELRDINLVAFPDWSQPEESLYEDLSSLILTLINHPDQNQISLFIDTHNISQEDANLTLNSVLMNLIMVEELELDESLEITLLEKMNPIQWFSLLPRLQGRIILKHDNSEAIASANAHQLQTYNLSEIQQQRVIQLETGYWQLQ